MQNINKSKNVGRFVLIVSGGKWEEKEDKLVFFALAFLIGLKLNLKVQSNFCTAPKVCKS